MAETTVAPANKPVRFRGKAKKEPKRAGLPKGARRAAKAGLISERQMKRLHDGA